MQNKELNIDVNKLLQAGTVIPAHPLALNKDRRLDEMRQKALTRYYIASGAGGVAVGVHTTQFEIRKPEINLLETVLKITTDEINNAELQRPFIKVAGICGVTANAIKEADMAVSLGYDLALLSMGGLQSYSENELLKHAFAISEKIALFGFYLQPAVGGRVLSHEFWRDFVEIPNLHAIKVAAFNRYQTLDVVRAVCYSERRNAIALYTGNDDNIVADLLTPYRFVVNGEPVEKRFVGGLLGHWAVWTWKAVELLGRIKKCIASDYSGIAELLSTGAEVTDMNAVIFDAKNLFKGSIPGIHEALRRQGFLEGIWCLNPEEKLADGQMEEIDRIFKDYQHLMDNSFVKKFFDEEKNISQFQKNSD